MAEVRVGTAGWSIPTQHAADFPGDGTHLERYARFFSAVEINSSFYRLHRPRTYERWAASVPPPFRFAVKLPREISHRKRLVAATEPLECFLAHVEALKDRLGPLLLQLPPSLCYENTLAGRFLEALRARFVGNVVCEPRHHTWFEEAADKMLSQYQVGRVAADPAPAPRADEPGGWPGIVYCRLHGSPRVYYSAYSAERLDTAARIARAPGPCTRESWCIFDNTASGEATGNALSLLRRLEQPVL